MLKEMAATLNSVTPSKNPLGTTKESMNERISNISIPMYWGGGVRQVSKADPGFS